MEPENVLEAACMPSEAVHAIKQCEPNALHQLRWPLETRKGQCEATHQGGGVIGQSKEILDPKMAGAT